MAADGLTDRATVRRLLLDAGVRPSKRLGQNFLVDGAAVDAIARVAADAKPTRIVEIGAGLGAVTRALAPLAPEVVAIELDRRLADVLEQTVSDLDSVSVWRGDILDYAFEGSGNRGTIVVGSLPYASTAAILQHLVAHRGAISTAVVLTQREVAEKIAASPGQAGSALGVLVRAYADVEIHRAVGRGSFHPVPDVDSLLWAIRFLDRPRFEAESDTFFAVVRTIYGVRRKMLRVALRALASRETVAEVLDRAGVEGTDRGETLGFDALDRLARAFEGVEILSGTEKS